MSLIRIKTVNDHNVIHNHYDGFQYSFIAHGRTKVEHVCAHTRLYTTKGDVLTISVIGHSVVVTNVQFSISYEIEISD